MDDILVALKLLLPALRYAYLTRVSFDPKGTASRNASVSPDTPSLSSAPKPRSENEEASAPARQCSTQPSPSDCGETGIRRTSDWPSARIVADSAFSVETGRMPTSTREPQAHCASTATSAASRPPRLCAWKRISADRKGLLARKGAAASAWTAVVEKSGSHRSSRTIS